VTDTRLTLRKAAAVLGVSESAIRKRAERGTLRSDKGPDGKRYVYLDTVADNVADERADTSATPERDALVSELRAHNDTLREQLKAERHAHAEARRIIAGLVERIPAIEAPQEASEACEKVDEEAERSEPRSTAGVDQRGREPRSEDGSPLRRLYDVVGVILSMLAATFWYYLLRWFAPSFDVAYLWVALSIVPLVVIPAFFGIQLGRKVRRLRFWRHLVLIGTLVGVGSGLVLNGALAVEIIGRGGTVGFIMFDVEETLIVSVTPALGYISAAILGNAIQRRNRERLVEESPSGFPQESSSAAHVWTPRQQAIVGLAGTIISALIGLFGTILTVMSSG
jgi:hypothetical protein